MRTVRAHLTLLSRMLALLAYLRLTAGFAQMDRGRLSHRYSSRHPGEPRENKLEHADAFLSVIEKMIKKYPNFKSRMYMMMKRTLDPAARMFSSNPSTDFGDGSMISPMHIYMNFKSILDADEMLREDMKKLVRQTQMELDMVKIKKKTWFNTMDDLAADLKHLDERKHASADGIALADIDVQLATKKSQLKACIEMFDNAEAKEKELNKLLGDLVPF